MQLKLNVGNYPVPGRGLAVLRAPILSSLKIAGISTLLCLLIGYPMAYAHRARARRPGATSLLMLVILPFWTSFLLRVYAWIGLLKNNGADQQRADVARHHRRAAS